MMIYPELTLALSHDRHRELVAETDRSRILKAARRAPRTRSLTVATATRSRGDGSVTTCVPRAAAPAGR